MTKCETKISEIKILIIQWCLITWVFLSAGMIAIGILGLFDFIQISIWGFSKYIVLACLFIISVVFIIVIHKINKDIEKVQINEVSNEHTNYSE